jgi:hypothetical protein
MLSLNRIAGFYLAISFSFLCLHSFGSSLPKQAAFTDTAENNLKGSFIRYHKLYPQEKLFVHTDEQTYSSGETIWFKVYSLCYGKPSTLSKIVYLQLTNDSGKLVYQNKAPLISGKAYGNINLSPAIKSGWYHLSAFTAWMINFDYRLYYHQNIYIINPNSTADPKIITADPNYKIDFYPESGDLISGSLANIAFKAVSTDGTPLQVHGLIKNNKNRSVIAFKTTHYGMGTFSMEVLPGAVYTATVFSPDGNQREVLLPEVKSQGISLRANQGKDTIELKLMYAGPQNQYADCILAVSQNYGQIATYPLHLGKGFNVYDLAKNLFKTGIVRFTIFSSTGVPEAERVVLVNNHDTRLSLSADDSTNHTGQSVSTLKFLLKNSLDKAVNANLSVSVIDVSQGYAPAATANIYSGLLLSPELDGSIYNAGYYFTNPSDSLQNQLDLVMLTNGWRHFVWKPMLPNQKPAIKHPIETEQFISGEIVDYKKPQNFKSTINILIVNQDSSKFVGQITPDSLGRFILPNFNHSGLSKIYIERLEKGKYTDKLSVRLFTTLADSLQKLIADTISAFATPTLPPGYLSAQKEWALSNMQTQGIILQEVEVKTREISPTNKLIKEHVGSLYQADRAFTADLVNNPSVEMDLVDYLRGRFPGLQVYGSKLNVQFIYLSTSTLQTSAGGKTNNSTGGNPYPTPYFFVNEAPVLGLPDIRISDIALIRFVPPPVSFAPYNGGSVGAILIYTKTHADDVSLLSTDNNFNHFAFNGYSITREFKSDSHKNQPFNGNIKNNRLLLYWAHDINTNNHGEAEIKIEPGNAKRFEVVIQGMDDDGNLVYHQQYFDR